MNRRSYGFVRLGGGFWASLLMPWCVVACQSSASSAPNSGKAVNSPELVSIAASTVTSGFSRGVLRQSRRIAAFEISKHPVTWQEFESCVASGKCAVADDSACSGASSSAFPGYSSAPFSEKSAASPAVCVGEKQAEAYCRAVNGRLPTLDEWLLAARGSSPSRFAWGDQPPTRCDQHPFAAQLIYHLHSGDPTAMEGCPPPAVASDENQADGNAVDASVDAADGDAGNQVADVHLGQDDLKQGEFSKNGLGKKDLKKDLGRKDLGKDDLAVGKHSHGASPSGIEDVLLTPGELLKSDEKALFPACTQANSHCVVFGTDPGAIDGVQPFYKVPADQAAAAPVVTGRAYGFRCVVSVSEVSK